MDSPIIPIVVVVFFILLPFRRIITFFVRRLETEKGFTLRPLASFDAMQGQVGQAIESGSQMHVTLGQASVAGPNSPTTVAALVVLDHLAEDGCANGVPPLVTVGEGTILLAAQDSLYHGFAAANRPQDYRSRQAQFVAHDSDPFVYAGGVSAVLQQDKVIGNVMVGRFGAEVAIMSASAERRGIEQVIGTDDPTAMAIATAVTDNTLIGEELFAAGAYLKGKPDQIASLRIQDILRSLIMAAILIWAILQLL
jgi:hypothetical protein